jgi:hypothetical protein
VLQYTYTLSTNKLTKKTKNKKKGGSETKKKIGKERTFFVIPFITHVDVVHIMIIIIIIFYIL